MIPKFKFRRYSDNKVFDVWQLTKYMNGNWMVDVKGSSSSMWINGKHKEGDLIDCNIKGD